MQLIYNIDNPEPLAQKLSSWAKNLSKYASFQKVGRYLLDSAHAKLWVPELEIFLTERNYSVDKIYLEIYQRTVFSDWQKFIPENVPQFALHVPLEGCDNWIVEYVANQSMPAYDKLGIKFCSNSDSKISKHFGYRELDSMFIMSTNTQWRRSHVDRPSSVTSKSLLITLTTIK